MSAVCDESLVERAGVAVQVISQVRVAGQVMGNVLAVEGVLEFVAGELDGGLEEGLDLLVDVGAGVAPRGSAGDRRCRC